MSQVSNSGESFESSGPIFPIGKGKSGKSLDRLKPNNKRQNKHKKSTEPKDIKDKLSKKFPGALYRHKERLMCRDRKGQYQLCEIMEIRNKWVEPSPENDTEEIDKDDIFGQLKGANKRFKDNPETAPQSQPVEQKQPEETKKLQEFSAWQFWFMSNSHEDLNNNHQYEYFVSYVGTDRGYNRWVPHYFLLRDQETIEKLEAKFKKDDKEADIKKLQVSFPYFPNNTHPENWSPEEIDGFLERTRIKTVEFIQYGNEKLIEAMYYSPLPEELHGRILYVCPYCLNYFSRKFELEVHSEVCKERKPPGDEIYRDEQFSIFEVDARRAKQYSVNLCYLSNMFLDHKNPNCDISIFNFYVLCSRKSNQITFNQGLYMWGYFSKARNQRPLLHDTVYENLSCIMVLPGVSGGGLGKFLVDFSYKLSKKEGRQGSAERPFSDGGHYIYLGYWTYKIITYLIEHTKDKNNIGLTLADIALHTGIHLKDIQYLLTGFGVLIREKDKTCIYADPKYLEALLKTKWGKKPLLTVQSELIHWVPHLDQIAKDDKK